MIPKEKLKISFEERSFLGLQVIASQPAISHAHALRQIERLKEISKINSWSKKGRQ